MSPPPSNSRNPGSNPSFTSRLATSASALSRDALAIRPGEIADILPPGGSSSSKSADSAPGAAFSHRDVVVDYVSGLRLGAGGLAARRRNREFRSRHGAPTARQEEREEDQFQQFLDGRNTTLRMDEQATPQGEGSDDGHVQLLSFGSTSAQDIGIHRHPELNPSLTTPSHPARPTLPPQAIATTAQTLANGRIRPQQSQHSRNLQRRRLLQQNVYLRRGAKQWAAKRLDPFFKRDFKLSDQIIAESKRLFGYALDNPHFVRTPAGGVEDAGAVVQYEYSMQDAKPVLGACMYIAQVNLGMTIKDEGMSVAQICEATRCSSEELARWSQILGALIRPERRQERRAPEGPGMGMTVSSAAEMPVRGGVPRSTACLGKEDVPVRRLRMVTAHLPRTASEQELGIHSYPHQESSSLFASATSASQSTTPASPTPPTNPPQNYRPQQIQQPVEVDEKKHRFARSRRGRETSSNAVRRLGLLQKRHPALSAEVIAESQRLFDRAMEIRHFTRAEDGVVFTFDKTNGGQILGACMYIAQMNLGIEGNGGEAGQEEGLNAAQICRTTNCSEEQLARWSQLLRTRILPGIGSERTMSEGSGENMAAGTTTPITATTIPATTIPAKTPAPSHQSPQIPQPPPSADLQQLEDASSAVREAKKDWAAIRLCRFCDPPFDSSRALVAEAQRLFNRAIDKPHYARRVIDGVVVPYEYREQDMKGVLGACVYIAQLNLGMSLGAGSNTDEDGRSLGREGVVGLSIPQICEAAQCHANELARWSWLIKKPEEGKGLEQGAGRRVPEGPGMSMIGMTGEMGMR